MPSAADKIRVRFLTQTDEWGASARLRAYAYAPYLGERGFEMTVDPLRTRPTTWGYAKATLTRFVRAPLVRASADVIVLQRDLVNHLYPFLEKLYAASGVPLILDVDDAIDLRPPGHPPTWRTRLFGSTDKLAAIAKLCGAVVAGNEYLAEKVRPYCARVEVIPTCLDLSLYRKLRTRTLPRLSKERPLIVGWIGSPLTTPYLDLIRGALAELAKKRPIVLRTVGAAPLDWPEVPLEQRPWEQATERLEVEGFDVGVMPLTDDEWSRAKCGTKILQYFAAAVPVIASPVGMNAEALEGGAGLAAGNSGEWLAAFERLLGDANLYARLSAGGRQRAEERFDVRVHAPRWAALLDEVVRGGS